MAGKTRYPKGAVAPEAQDTEEILQEDFVQIVDDTDEDSKPSEKKMSVSVDVAPYLHEKVARATRALNKIGWTWDDISQITWRDEKRTVLSHRLGDERTVTEE